MTSKKAPKIIVYRTTLDKINLQIERTDAVIQTNLEYASHLQELIKKYQLQQTPEPKPSPRNRP